MSEDQLRYDRLVEDALRSVVREALLQVAEHGLPGDHHFYITFHTNDPGVEIPEVLHAQYPEEMTIVLQHQFWGLEVEEKAFAVTLSFNNRHERLYVPFSAITAFADPAVKFGLQFEVSEADLRMETQTTAGAGQPDADAAESEGDDDQKSAEVVTLDAFRKK
ncbi:ClpXP protease specificity-enhancing factor SspB [Rhodospirillaceae bacterium SYSU D60014]|uniref:SspB family protein n=1 Tax=Virgifigura deserti TaxID=2268457 RepID=UPI000E673775